jgi:hypothetical protein
MLGVLVHFQASSVTQFAGISLSRNDSRSSAFPECQKKKVEHRLKFHLIDGLVVGQPETIAIDGLHISSIAV